MSRTDLDCKDKLHELDSLKNEKFERILSAQTIDKDLLKEASWNGIPKSHRPLVWKILLGYISGSKNREASLLLKRQEYKDKVNHLFSTSVDHSTLHQIKIDVPRTFSSVRLFSYKCIQDSLIRILYCWADRHPASSYVQGINDLVTPFFVVFLSEFVNNPQTCLENEIKQHDLEIVEADSYWCLTKLIDNVQDNYTEGQPGIHRQINRLKTLMQRIDLPLYNHLESENVDYIQISFRWINCFLMRELSIQNIIRMWDTYLSEPAGFSDFHVYVCASFLEKWSHDLAKKEFQDIVLFLQRVPTSNWTVKEIEVLLAEAFMWKSIFHEIL